MTDAKDSLTWRQLYDNYFKSNGIKHKSDRPLTPPPGYLEITQAYWDIESGRGSGFGPQAITWSDIHAYAQLNEIRFNAIETDMLRALDAVRMEEAAARRKRKQEADKKSPQAGKGRRR